MIIIPPTTRELNDRFTHPRIEQTFLVTIAGEVSNGYCNILLQNRSTKSMTRPSQVLIYTPVDGCLVDDFGSTVNHQAQFPFKQ